MKPKFLGDGRCTCGHPSQPEIVAPGYGVRKDGSTMCIDCVTIAAKNALERRGTGQLVLCEGFVMNEAKTLQFDIVHRSKADHNVAKVRHDIWFIGPDGMRWQGTRYGAGDGPMNVRRCTGLHQLRAQLQAEGLVLYLKDGEYRVNYRHGKEDTAYYTNDPLDAYRTGLRMASERDAPKPIDIGWTEG